MTLIRIGHLFYASSSFVHHFVAIDQFKLSLQSGNAKFGSKSVMFLSCVTLKFGVWPWKIIGNLFHATSSFVHHVYPSVNSNWSYSPETQHSGQIMWFSPRVTLEFDGWPWNTIRHLFKPTSRFVLHFVAICESKPGLQSGNVQCGNASWKYQEMVIGILWKMCNDWTDCIDRMIKATTQNIITDTGNTVFLGIEMEVV